MKLRNPNLYLSILLVAYTLFTTGIVFEVGKVDSIASMNLPYNPTLSGGRLDLTGNYTPDDEAVRDWLMRSDIEIIYADFYGLLFLQERMAMEKELLFIPDDGTVPQGSYLYLRSYNETSGKLTFHVGPGARRQAEFKLNFPVVFQSGNAKVVRVE